MCATIGNSFMITFTKKLKWVTLRFFNQFKKYEIRFIKIIRHFSIWWPTYMETTPVYYGILYFKRQF